MGQGHNLATYVFQWVYSELFAPLGLEPMFIPIICGWILLFGLFLWAVGVACWEGMAHLKRLHQVPCDRCTYFTGNNYLKCTVHPCRAMTEEAIGCLDFEHAQPHCANRYIPACKVQKHNVKHYGTLHRS